MLPETRATRDLSGRLVDLYPAAEDTIVSVLVLDRTRVNESRLRYDVFAVMVSITAMSDSRLRERDFPIYLCNWTTGGRRLTGIGLPKVFPVSLHLAFQRLIKATTGITEISEGRASDVGARPFMLYNRGKLIAYADAFGIASQTVPASSRPAAATMMDNLPWQRWAIASPTGSSSAPSRERGL